MASATELPGERAHRSDMIAAVPERCSGALTGSDGRIVELWADQAYPVLQLFTGDTLAPDRARRGLAVEPTTAPVNALQTGDHLVRLEPGEVHVATWGGPPPLTRPAGDGSSATSARPFPAGAGGVT